MSLEKKELVKLTMDEELKNLIPPQTDQEYVALSESIGKYGCIDPITVWKEKNIIIDGHHRYEICRRLAISFFIKEVEFEDREAAKIWMLQYQLARRNLNIFQRSELALKFKNSLAARAKENQQAARGVVPMKSAKPLDTREEMAIMAGVSPDTISKADRIIKEADEKEIQRLRNGETKINTVISKLNSSCEKKEGIDQSTVVLEKRFQSLLKGIDTRIDQIFGMDRELLPPYRERLNQLIEKLTILMKNQNIISAA